MSGVRDALLGIGARHREPLLLLWAELGGLKAAEQVDGRRGLPGPARELQGALFAFLSAYGRRGALTPAGSTAADDEGAG